jgi:ubiquinone/menaquinone biosynthesis C-methylase UbiE
MSSTKSADGYGALYSSIAERKAQPMSIPAENLVRIIKQGGIRPPDEKGIDTLDFGCGEGRHTEYLADLGFRILATDVSEAAISATKLRMAGKPVEFSLLELAGSKIPAEDSSLSLIVAWEVLHWLGSKQTFLHYLKEFARVIKKERQGHFIFTMPTEYFYVKLEALEIGESQYRCQTTDREDFVMYAPNLVTIRAMLEEHGFKAVRTKNYSLSDEEWGGLHKQFSHYAIHCVCP